MTEKAIKKQAEDPFKKHAKEKRLVVIDGNHLIHRAFYAIQAPLKTSSGEQTNAIYGFAGMLLNIIEQEKPDYMALTFDEHAKTFRHEAHEEYKATRVKAPDELYAQIPRIREMIKCFNIPIYTKEGYEADDMMGTLAVKASRAGLSTYLVTGDMDMLQLVDGDVHVVFPHKGYREPIVYDGEAVYKKYGIHPDQVVDYKAMVGDVSDNIKGVDGIGPKGASDLLGKFKTLDGIYEHLEEIGESQRGKLVRDQDKAYFARSLARIVTDVPCDFKKEDTDFDKLDFQGLLKFFEEMEMKSLQSRLKKLIPEDKLQPKEQMSLF
jgi:DNA polymerase-1